jgi:surface antigen
MSLRLSLRPFALVLAALVALTAVPPAVADPPPHAPAHGWRKKHDPYYLGYYGSKWPKDYGILVGRCDYSAVGAVLGGVAGAVIGSQIGKGEGRTVAILAGTVLGAIIGARIGRDWDEVDRACIGHTLELAPPGRRVIWRNPHTGIDYVVIPGESFRAAERDCREFTAERYFEGRRVVERGRACRDEGGEWQLM